MSMSYMTNPLVFLIDTVFSLYILAVLLRLLLQWVRADFYNPISQFLIKITQPPLKLLRRFVPAVGHIDTSSLVLALALQMLSDGVILALQGVSVGLVSLLVLAFSQLISAIINIFIFAIFARAILSWINPGDYRAASSVLSHLSEPVLTLCRNFVPDMGGIDLSPLVGLVFLQLLKMLLLPPLQQLVSLIG